MSFIVPWSKMLFQDGIMWKAIFRRNEISLSSREPTYLLLKALLKMIFLFSSWDMLVPCRVSPPPTNNQRRLPTKETEMGLTPEPFMQFKMEETQQRFRDCVAKLCC